MRQSLFLLHSALLMLVAPILACGPIAAQITPTPTKTPKRIQVLEQLPTHTPTPALLPTNTPVPEVIEAPPADTPTPEPLPPTDTPTPEPLPPTDTPLPPPPTNTPLPPPPTDTPAPPTDTPPPPTPANRGPDVVVQLPNGDTYSSGSEIRIIIIVTDPDGVKSFTWGIFAENRSPLPVGGTENCGNRTECRIEQNFAAPPFQGQFAVGVEAVDVLGQGTQINAAQIYLE